jgi:hypothetical protein
MVHRSPRASITGTALALLAAALSCSSSASYRQCSEVPTERLARLPERLSQTGLYVDLASGRLADGVQAFAPRFELWSDGATKRRFVWLPPGSVIDSSDPDAWRFPVGTKLWKEFVVPEAPGSKRVETRLLTKVGPDDDAWVAAAYVWRDDDSDAVLAPAGAVAVRGTAHDVPAAALCFGCHGGTHSRVLGFSAAQLPWQSDSGVSLTRLRDDGRLSHPVAAPLVIPGDETTQRALGTLHANCAHCHNQDRPEHDGPRCFNPSRGSSADAKRRSDPFDLSLRTSALGSVEATPLYKTAVGRVIVPGAPADSALIRRVRGDFEAFQARMPPLAT